MASHPQVPLEITGSCLELLYSYNPETGEFIHKTYRGGRGDGPGSAAGVIMSHGYVAMSIRGKQFTVHRLAWVWMTGKWPEKEIDHINGNRADNRWCNLREADRSQQSQNGKIRNTNKAGRLGVFYDKARDQYTASIERRGRKWRKRFDTFELAIAARERAEKEWFGEYAPQSHRVIRG